MTKKIISIFACILLGACSGGSGGSNTQSNSGPVISTLSFPLAQSIANFSSQTQNIPLNVTGTEDGYPATGTGTLSAAAAVGTTFEGQPALSRTVSIVASITINGNTIPAASTVQSIDTTDYDPVAFIELGNYCVNQSASTYTYPSSVQVGDTAVVGTLQCYQDSTETVKNGHIVLAYTIEADTSNTAIADLIVDTYNATDVFQDAAQVNYQIDQNGNFTFLSESVTDYATSPANVLIYTAN